MMLGVVVGVAPAGATESPPVFVAKWGSQGTGDGQFSYTKGLAALGISAGRDAGE